MRLSEKIVRLRKARGMSQEALAEQLGVSRQAVSRWELGSALPDASNLLQLSRLFGVSADYLLNDAYEDAQNAVLEKKPGKQRSAAKLAGLCLAGFGLLCNLVIYVLSRFIEVMVPHVTHVDGETWYTYSSGITARSYKYFIKEYNMELLAALFWLLTVIGLVMIFVPRGKFAQTLDQLRTFLKKKSGRAGEAQADAAKKDG